mgnify:CR=1 FL=1
MRTVKLYIESKNGHDTQEVPEDKLPEAVKDQVKDGKWVHLEKQDGQHETLTSADLPQEENPVENDKWAEKFEQVESATATNKVKGG